MNGDWWVRTYGDVTAFVFAMFECMSDFLDAINIKIPIRVYGNDLQIPIFSFLIGAIIISFVASVFVKGAKG